MLSLISDSDDTWDPVLAEIFTCLPASFNDVLACVNKRWKNLADSAYWKPDLLLYSWGHKLSAGHQNSDGEDGDSETDFNDFELEANEEAHNWIRAPKMLECFYSPRPSFQIQQVASGDYYTLALSLDGQVFEWGQPLLSDVISKPTRMPELQNVVEVSVTAAGYYHQRRHGQHTHAAAVTSKGSLYMWGANANGQCLLPIANQGVVRRPQQVQVKLPGYEASDPSLPVLHVGCGVEWTVLQMGAKRGSTEAAGNVKLASPASCSSGSDTSSAAYRVFETDTRPLMGQYRHRQVLPFVCKLREVFWGTQEIDHGRDNRGNDGGLSFTGSPRLEPLAQVACGAFACCLRAQNGELWSFGSKSGPDEANGSLLGNGISRNPSTSTGYGFELGPPLPREMARRVHMPENAGPVARVSGSSYTFVAVTDSGVAYSWGDSDGGSLGHGQRRCDVPFAINPTPDPIYIAAAAERGPSASAAAERRNRRVRRANRPLTFQELMRTTLLSVVGGGLMPDEDQEDDGESDESWDIPSDSSDSEDDYYYGMDGDSEATTNFDHSGVNLDDTVRIRNASVSYTNGALVTQDGTLLVFGGGSWANGISDCDGHTEMVPHNAYMRQLVWRGVAKGYAIDSLVLAHRHAFVIARKVPPPNPVLSSLSSADVRAPPDDHIQ